MKLGKIKKIAKLPPRVTASKLKNKTSAKAQKLKAMVFDTFPSDRQFYSALAIDNRGKSLINYYQKRTQPKFFISHQTKKAVIKTVQEQYPKSIKETITAANEVCNHTFNLLGSGKTSLGKEIDWHCDFKTGKRWGEKFYTDIKCVNLSNLSDVKVPWELSRFQHLTTLGKAYWYTGDEKYAQEFVSQLTDWVAKNPPQYGVNWACTMDVAIRAANLIWGYYFLADSPSFPTNAQLALFKSLLTHGRHIINNLEYGTLTSNHYLSNLIGLIYLGIMLPEFKESKKWLGKGLRDLALEMEKQVYPDGVDFEASISYHRLVLELFLSATLLAELNDISLPDEFLTQLEKMFEFVMYYTKPDGTTPTIGDADDGRLHALSEYTKNNINDHRYLLSVGAVLFNRSDFTQAAGKFFEEAFWLLGEEGLKKFNQLSKNSAISASSHAFQQGGIYIMRDKNLYLIIDAGKNGQNGNGGHAHNDTLSFELFAFDKSFIIDPGTYVYTADYKQRNRFRSTAYHNTVAVDNQEMNRIDEKSLFSLANDAIPKINRWENTDDYDIFDGEHNGYMRLRNSILHRRQIYFDKKDCFWIIKDILTGEGVHQFDLYFHFAPMEITTDKENYLVVSSKCPSGSNIIIIPLETERLSLEITEGWVSPSYGKKIQSPVIRYYKKEEAPTNFTTLIMPYSNSRPDISDATSKNLLNKVASIFK